MGNNVKKSVEKVRDWGWSGFGINMERHQQVTAGTTSSNSEDKLTNPAHLFMKK